MKQINMKENEQLFARLTTDDPVSETILFKDPVGKIETRSNEDLTSDDIDFMFLSFAEEGEYDIKGVIKIPKRMKIST